MNRLARFLGPLGLVLTLIGGVTYGILYSSGWVAVLPLAAGLCLVIASAVIGSRGARTEGMRRRERAGLNAFVATVLLVAVLVFLQAILSRHAVRYDSTANKRFSLAEQTAKILRGLDRAVTITCFFKDASPGRTELDDLLREYAAQSRHVKYSFIDPDRDPVSARRYEIRSYGTIVFESGTREEKLNQITEEKLTNAILKVTREGKKTIYSLTGHGEKSIDATEGDGLGELKQAIEADNFEIRSLFALRDSIPADCAVLFVPGPEKDITPAERAMIERYLAGGGTVLLLVDPLVELPRVDSLAASYGIEATPNIVVDRAGKLLAGNYLTPIVNSYGIHPITEDFRLASLFPQARALAIAQSRPAGVETKVLARTGESAYAEEDAAALLQGTTQFEPREDMPGPINVAIVATRTSPAEPAPPEGAPPARRSRVIVFGDSDFATNAYLSLFGNRDLILNTIGWLADEEDLIAIRAKNPLSQPVILSQKQGRVAFWLPVIGLPAVFGVIGVLVLVAKRKSA